MNADTDTLTADEAYQVCVHALRQIRLALQRPLARREPLTTPALLQRMQAALAIADDALGQLTHTDDEEE